MIQNSYLENNSEKLSRWYNKKGKILSNIFLNFTNQPTKTNPSFFKYRAQNVFVSFLSKKQSNYNYKHTSSKFLHNQLTSNIIVINKTIKEI